MEDSNPNQQCPQVTLEVLSNEQIKVMVGLIDINY